MGLDFLGTLNREQWDSLQNFVSSAKSAIEEKRVESDEYSIFITHLQAELARANLIYSKLEAAVKDFADFKGDDQVLRDRISTEGKSMRTKYRLDDSDTAFLVDNLKNPIRQIIKRKKDNLEYRIKKYYDLIDQLELKIIYFLDYTATSDIFIESINTHFTDELHSHNTSEEDRRTPEGYIQHVNTEFTVNNKDTMVVEQEKPTYINPARMNQ